MGLLRGAIAMITSAGVRITIWDPMSDDISQIVDNPDKISYVSVTRLGIIVATCRVVQFRGVPSP